ncbi:ABC transporter substrate-binding protein [Roseomonas sp. GC11]|uniref:ABC transporter substrate-binding protein n=1 Tax=Roseomonas sp. GC11 TaxID=2950546 RepID=UPI00210CDE00|nr:ABC transporter substrate-binding protein [Roseomonas sp. GC11]MCQ4162043.1 ABC transporter substrate-binding protein [Roseomonas sp. GC11]
MHASRRHVLSLAALAALSGSGLFDRAARAAAPLRVVDITGREVTIQAPVRRILLGEGRQSYALAALDTADPFARVIGWRDDFRKADLDGYRLYEAKYPAIAKLPTFGGWKEGAFDIEQVITLRPDVVVMNLESKGAIDEGNLTAKLERAGIPLIFIDFREKPFENAERSIAILGAVLGREERAAELAAYRRAQIARVTDRLASYTGPRPRVMIERAAGFDEGCCMSFGNENFGRMVSVAGGENIAAGLIPGTFGTLNPEQVVASQPEVVIVTGSNWTLFAPDGGWVGVGPGADQERARERLRRLMQRPAYRTLPVVGRGRVHAIWHQFYDSPYQFVAIQALAKWLHPDLFADLDPDATFREFHARFLPIDYKPGYWVSLS